ncbi:fungal-specific transcription factor domain-containing protein [Leptodontidium sp. 2 PMI_412]|nr:fungal-specific transcription factor domain-containing protein [Leptodontidium sp. 2 PMI_412]
MNESVRSHSSAGSPTPRRPPRSKSGCLTCRRRKVRCNEHKPRCSHCERLNLECLWRPTQQSSRQASSSLRCGNGGDSYTSNRSGSSAPLSASALPNMTSSGYSANDNSFNDIFNYASFMWDPTVEDNLMQASGWRGQGFSDLDGQHIERNSIHLPPDWSTSPTDHMPSFQIPEPDLNSRPLVAFNQSGEKELMEYFTRTVVPPIIAQVETELKWSSMRQLLISMATASPMVRYAILAFSELLMGRERSVVPQYQQYYQKAAAEVQRYVSGMSPGSESISAATLEYVLATLFFLSYIDLLEGGIGNAHAHLKHAYDVFCKADKSQFRMVGKRLVSWIRLLDARAVSAGGEGLFLLENNDEFIDQSSPATTVEVAEGSTDNGEADIEDVLFDALYQPGFLFFQKIQSFMGRISLIDPWHRSRGTVKDETEVMSIAAKIGRDLTSLWEQRPPLMDYALSGKLTSAHLSPSLAFAITRTFRTYYANYHASKIHLHRVAYKHLPLAAETEASVANIRSTARVMVEGSLEEEFLPVSMLWPLLMWGSEENDAEMQTWIHGQINRMEKVATNAEITGQVLREVQTRQEALKQRVDIRTVMHDIFNSCFAIV